MEQLRHVRGRHLRLFIQRPHRRRSPHNRPIAHNHRNPVLPLKPVHRGPAVFPQPHPLHLHPNLLLHLIEELIFKTQRVNQPGRHRLIRQKRPVIQQLPHLGATLLPRRANGIGQMPVQPIQQQVQRLPALRRHVGARVAVQRVFILARVLGLHLHAQLVERALVIGDLRAHPFHVQVVFRHHMNPVRRRRQVILRRPRRPQKHEQRLAGGLVLNQPPANLLQLRPAHGKPARHQHHGLNLRINRGLL